MLVSIFFDSTAAVARVSDLRFPLLSQSLVPLQSENQLVTTKAVSPKRRSLGSARASRAGDRARAIANFRPIGWVYRILGGGAEKCTRRACAPQITSPRWLLHVHDAFNWGWSSFLQNSYLPIAVLPALIAFPKNCKHKY